MPWGTNPDGTPNIGGGIYNQFNGMNSPDSQGGSQNVDLGSAFGFSQYQTPEYDINQQSFVNPVGNQAPAWQSGMNNYYGVGNNQVQAPSMQAAQLGAASTAAGPDMGGFNNAQGGLGNLANTYAQMAAGNGPSLAAVQAKQQGAQNLQNALAAQGAVGGSSNPALAQYNIANQAQTIQNQTNQQAVQGRTQEELGALGAEGGIYGQMQQGALGAAGMQMNNNQFNAGQLNQFGLQQGQFNQQAAMNNLQSQLATGQLNAQQYNNYMQQLYGMNQQQFNAQQAYENLAVQQQLGVGQINNSAYQAAASKEGGFLGGLMGGGGSILGGFL